jgi:formylglycine-generating enzyme required for sulfatase activity
MSQKLDELLKLCTVKLTCNSRTDYATGFFVAPSLLLTCSHFLKNLPTDFNQIQWEQKELSGTATVEKVSPDCDLALLKLNELSYTQIPCVYLDNKNVQKGTQVVLFGYSEDFLKGAPETYLCEGFTGDHPPLIKFKFGQVSHGMSGSPLLNCDTQKICGVTQFTLDSGPSLVGGGAIPVSTIYREFPELKELQQQFHQKDVRWLEASLNESSFETVLDYHREEPHHKVGKAYFFRETLNEAVSLEMILIPGGAFKMGSPGGEGLESEHPQHLVEVPNFFISKYPITQYQWMVVADFPQVKHKLPLNPSHFNDENRALNILTDFLGMTSKRSNPQAMYHPVERVSWYEAVEFCERLSRKTGRKYSLPSEAEWEYACRAGTTTLFNCGNMLDPSLANCTSDDTESLVKVLTPFRNQTTVVGSRGANPFGLYDMHGNVWEWCSDFWHETYEDAPCYGDPWVAGAIDSSLRSLRGGSWADECEDCRSARRKSASVDARYSNIGFRVCCV